MRGLPTILSFFRSEFNKFNNTGARMSDSFHHMTLKLPKIAFWECNRQCFATFYATLSIENTR